MRFADAAPPVGLLAAGLLAAVVGLVRAANRLDWLHIRTDAAWAALEGALSRRALVVSGLDVVLTAAGSHEAASRAIWAGPATREEIENQLCRELAGLDRIGLDPNCAALLADAEQRVVIARHVYNDAVRDTLALRSRRMVRWFRLAGTAPLPRYFEIAEPGTAGVTIPLRGGCSAGVHDGAGA